MSSLTNITIDDNSPLITYIGNWDGTVHKGDPLVDQYSNTTFHASQSKGDSAVIYWTGGAIELYGAFRPNHGFFSISLDNTEKQYKNGTAMPDVFQQTMFSSGNLEVGDHKLVLTNEAEYNTSDTTLIWFDLDYITVQADPAQLESAAKAFGAQSMMTTGIPRVQAVMPPTGTPIPIVISGSPGTPLIGFEILFGLLTFILYIVV